MSPLKRMKSGRSLAMNSAKSETKKSARKSQRLQ